MTAARSGASMAGAASTAYSMGAMGKQGMSAVAGGLANVAKAASAGTSRTAQATADAFRESYQSGARSAFSATGGNSTKGTVSTSGAGSTASPPAQNAPAWASDLKRNQSLPSAGGTAIHAVGDAAGSGHAADLKESQ